jgi:hypothetical protein
VTVAVVVGPGTVTVAVSVAVSVTFGTVQTTDTSTDVPWSTLVGGVQVAGSSAVMTAVAAPVKPRVTATTAPTVIRLCVGRLMRDLL